MHISIYIDEQEKKILSRRAKKNLMTLKEQIENIVRRSCVHYSGKSMYKPIPIDDKLVSIFSKERRGRKRKRKNR